MNVVSRAQPHLIVTGAQRPSAIAGFLLGSVPIKLVQLHNDPLLVSSETSKDQRRSICQFRFLTPSKKDSLRPIGFASWRNRSLEETCLPTGDPTERRAKHSSCTR